MDDEYNKLILRLKANHKELFDLYQIERSHNAKLIEEIENYNNEIKKYKHKCQEIEIKYNNLKIASVLLGNEQKENSTKLAIDKIIREIDNCIALLNK